MEIEVLCRRREVWDNYPFFDNLVFLCEKKLDVLSSYVVKIIFFFHPDAKLCHSQHFSWSDLGKL